MTLFSSDKSPQSLSPSQNHESRIHVLLVGHLLCCDGHHVIAAMHNKLQQPIQAHNIRDTSSISFANKPKRFNYSSIALVEDRELVTEEESDCCLLERILVGRPRIYWEYITKWKGLKIDHLLRSAVNMTL